MTVYGRVVRRAVPVIAVLGCGGSRSAPPPPAPPTPASAPADPFERVALPDAKPGLSGLASDPSGALWAVAERDAVVYRVELDAGLRPRLEAFPVEGVPPGTDLEALAWLAPDRFAIGTEGHTAGTATVLLAERAGTVMTIRSSIALTEADVGIPLPKNHGAEGVCGSGDTMLVAIEGAGRDASGRWAPVVLIRDGRPVRMTRFRLTTETGKLSALDCVIGAADETVTVTAIERHFDVTRILSYVVDLRPGALGDATPTTVSDLDRWIPGRFNIEGLARWRGRFVAAHDNQWRTVIGVSELLVFPVDER